MANDINKSYQWAIQTCNAPKVGYSQTYRNQQTVNGITYYDCSSFIWYALKAGGFVTGSATGFYTGNMRSKLLSLGFVQVQQAAVSNGDICWRSGHTEMVYDSTTGQTMGAHKSGIPLAKQVSITDSSNVGNFSEFYSYNGGASGGYGYSIYVISALCGNAYRESHICPNQNQVSGSAYGTFQWDGSRKTNLLNWLSSNGYSTDDGNAQCEYLIYENDWYQNYGSYATLTDWLNSNSTDIEELTKCFCKNWERPGDEHMSERIEWANRCYNYILAHANDSSITDWILNPNPSTDYLGDNDALNNAIMLYRYFSAGGGGGGSHTDEKGSLPLWYYTRKRGRFKTWR